ncbi:MAG: undecaprenyl-diphosphate phosphatase [Erysipelotrichaceae bacterium]|nr:undecaprenyl-diphosphate phosphatase [Erysipelotrichaceae bacterium]
MLEIIKAILLGIIQGITEWLPISSTGHMILFNEIFPMELSTEFVNLFLVVIQFGSILAVLILYFHKLNPLSRKKSSQQKKDTWMLWAKVLVAAVPAAIAGLLLDNLIDAYMHTPVVIATTLILYGILFIALENQHLKPKTTSLSDLSFKTAFGIGAFQMLALIPGTSRSGSTILGAVFLGCSRFVAAEFSFFLAIPMMFGASALKLVKYFLKTAIGFTSLELIVLATGMIVAFVVSLLAIRFLMAYIKKHDFKVFGYYRIVLGVLIIAYFLFF